MEYPQRGGAVKVSAAEVTQVEVTITLNETEARGLETALSYFCLAEGGNNFEQGYHGEDRELVKIHKAARSLRDMLAKRMETLERRRT
jgi:hypothetical protein